MLNPHAILGAVIALQATHERMLFAAGVVGASWVWYSTLTTTIVAATFRNRITPFASLCIQRVSGTLTLVFAGALAMELA